MRQEGVCGLITCPQSHRKGLNWGLNLAFNYTSLFVWSLKTLWKYKESYSSFPWKNEHNIHILPFNFSIRRRTYLQPSIPRTPPPCHALWNVGTVLTPLGFHLSCRTGDWEGSHLHQPIPFLLFTSKAWYPNSASTILSVSSHLESLHPWKAELFFSLSFQPLYVHHPTPPLLLTPTILLELFASQVVTGSLRSVHSFAA